MTGVSKPWPAGSLNLPVELADHVEWLRLRALSERTIEHRVGILRLLAQHIAPTPLLGATTADLDGWQKRMLSSAALAVATRRSYVIQTRNFYRWALKERLIGEDPSTVLIAPHVPRGRPHPIGEVDLDSALRMAPPRIRPWLLLAAYCGLRCIEIAGLQREDVLDHLPRPMLRVVGKGDKTRLVPLAPLVLAALVEYGLPAGGPVFRAGNGRQVTAKHVSRHANYCLHRLGIRESIHALRHRFGTSMYQQTKDLRAVQELLGHTSPATTAIYTAPDDQATLAAVVALSQRLGRPAPAAAPDTQVEVAPVRRLPIPVATPAPAGDMAAPGAAWIAALEHAADVLDCQHAGDRDAAHVLLDALDRDALTELVRCLCHFADYWLCDGAAAWARERVDPELDEDGWEQAMEARVAEEVSVLRWAAAYGAARAPPDP